MVKPLLIVSLLQREMSAQADRGIILGLRRQLLDLKSQISNLYFSLLTAEDNRAKVTYNKTMKKRVSVLKTAKRVRRVQADTDRELKCISEFGRLKQQ